VKASERVVWGPLKQHRCRIVGKLGLDRRCFFANSLSERHERGGNWEGDV